MTFWRVALGHISGQKVGELGDFLSIILGAYLGLLGVGLMAHFRVFEC